MTQFLHDYAFVGAAGLLGVLFSVGALTAGRLVRPKSPPESERSTYESGAEPLGGTYAQSHHVRYYLYALLFLVFDIEVAFIIPWAVQVDGFGLFGLMEITLFIVVLALGLGYAWRKGVLDWHS